MLIYSGGSRASMVIWDANVDSSKFDFAYVSGDLNTGLTGSASLGNAFRGTTFNLTSTGFEVTYATYGAYSGGLGTVYYIAL